METTTTKKTNGDVTTPAGSTTPARLTDGLSGPLTGRAADALLEKAVTNLFLPPGAPIQELEKKAAAAAPTAPQPGEEGSGPVKTLPPINAGETADEKAQREASEAAELEGRAQENGRSVEDQSKAESAELARLDEIASRTGETPEEIYAREDAGQPEPAEKKPLAGESKTFTKEQVEKIVSDRVNNLKSENEDLKKQLAAKPVILSNDPLSHVGTVEELAALRSQQEGVLGELDQRIRQLNYAPGAVEKFIRGIAAKTPEIAARFMDAEGHEDYSPQKMGELLDEAGTNARNILAGIPRRETFLKDFAAAHDKAQKIHPWLAKQEDERTVQFNQIMNSPGGKILKAHFPAYEYWLGNAVAMHQLLVQNSKNGGKPANEARRKGGFIPRTASRGGGGGSGRYNSGGEISKLKENLKKTGSEKDLTALIERLPGVIPG